MLVGVWIRDYLFPYLIGITLLWTCCSQINYLLKYQQIFHCIQHCQVTQTKLALFKKISNIKFIVVISKFILSDTLLFNLKILVLISKTNKNLVRRQNFNVMNTQKISHHYWFENVLTKISSRNQSHKGNCAPCAIIALQLRSACCEYITFLSSMKTWFK